MRVKRIPAITRLELPPPPSPLCVWRTCHLWCTTVPLASSSYGEIANFGRSLPDTDAWSVGGPPGLHLFPFEWLESSSCIDAHRKSTSGAPRLCSAASLGLGVRPRSTNSIHWRGGTSLRDEHREPDRSKRRAPVFCRRLRREGRRRARRRDEEDPCPEGGCFNKGGGARCPKRDLWRAWVREHEASNATSNATITLPLLESRPHSRSLPFSSLPVAPCCLRH